MSIQELFGIDLPIVQAPMAGVQASALAIAVSNAGGLGSLPCALLTPEGIASELQLLIAGTRMPYNVNFFCHTDPVPDSARERAWRDLLQPYFSEFGIDASTIPQGPGRTPFNGDIADIVEPFRPPVVSFHFGLPDDALLQRVKSWGSKVIASATTVDEARWLEANGVDAVIAQGAEAGGHRGMFLTDDVSTQVGTFALLPQVVQAVRCPVIAAGGIADAAGVRAAMALGAAGVQCGTAFLLCPETTTSALHRAAITSEDARTTAVTNLFTGRPARGIVNRVMRELGYLNPAAPQFPLASLALAPLRAAAERAGRSDFTPLWVGQNASRCRAVSAATVVRELADASMNAA